MRPFLIYIFIVICPNSFGQQSGDTTNYHSGNGMRDWYMWFYGNGQFKTYFCCDICPGEESLGTYEVIGDTIIRHFNTHTVFEPHYVNPTDTIVSKFNSTDTLYFAHYDNGTYLVYDKKEFEQYVQFYEQSQDRRILIAINNKFYRKDGQVLY